jgi:DNA-binding NarL/FixJ family response regulator
MTLTNRETEILLDIAEGMTARESASLRTVSEYTVIAHRRNIVTKLGVSNLTAAVALAIRQGMIR